MRNIFVVALIAYGIPARAVVQKDLIQGRWVSECQKRGQYYYKEELSFTGVNGHGAGEYNFASGCGLDAQRMEKPLTFNFTLHEKAGRNEAGLTFRVANRADAKADIHLKEDVLVVTTPANTVYFFRANSPR